ncbi:MAG: PQQ-dependent sugar dehydrogenase [Planctomycetota bacterium]
MPTLRTAMLLSLATCSIALANTVEENQANGGITLPDGFNATVFADTVGRARHIAVRPNGDLYVALRSPQNGGGVVALRDTDGDGVADEREYFARVRGTGIKIHEAGGTEYLYFGEDTRIVRFAFEGDELVPSGDMEVVIDGFPRQGQHAAKPFDFDDAGNIYVTVGAPSNACQAQMRTPGSPGLRPCPQLERAAGIWRFEHDQLGVSQADGSRFATGLRHCVAIAVNPINDTLYVVQHGRDQLDSLFREHYSPEQNAELPAEELHIIRDDTFDAGWPYTYYNHFEGERMVAPEYGGDGDTVSDEDFEKPIQAFPGHWAPNGLIFYDADAFPERYHGGAFIAWHGSWNRGPFEQKGYNVTFTPFDGDLPSGDYEVFADGFKGKESIMSPREARYRPMGLAVAPDGALFISDSQRGRIWRVTHAGEE